MTEEELDRLEALVKAATPGPWQVVGNTVQSNGVFVMAGVHTWERRAHCDNELVAAARDAVPAMVAEVRRLNRIVEVETAACLRELNEYDTAAYFEMQRERDALRAEVDRLRTDLNTSRAAERRLQAAWDSSREQIDELCDDLAQARAGRAVVTAERDRMRPLVDAAVARRRASEAWFDVLANCDASDDEALEKDRDRGRSAVAFKAALDTYIATINPDLFLHVKSQPSD